MTGSTRFPARIPFWDVANVPKFSGKVYNGRLLRLCRMSSSFDSLDERLIVIHCEGKPYRIRLVFWNYDYKIRSNLDILHLDLCYLSRCIFISPQITSQAGTVAAQLRVEAEVCGEARRPCSEKWILKMNLPYFKGMFIQSCWIPAFFCWSKSDNKMHCFTQSFQWKCGNDKLLQRTTTQRRTVNCYILINTPISIPFGPFGGKRVYLSPRRCRVSRLSSVPPSCEAATRAVERLKAWRGAADPARTWLAEVRGWKWWFSVA